MILLILIYDTKYHWRSWNFEEKYFPTLKIRNVFKGGRRRGIKILKKKRRGIKILEKKKNKVYEIKIYRRGAWIKQIWAENKIFREGNRSQDSVGTGFPVGLNDTYALLPVEGITKVSNWIFTSKASRLSLIALRASDTLFLFLFPLHFFFIFWSL